MKILVKLLDRNLIRRYGKEIEVNQSTADMWERENKCRIERPSEEKKENPLKRQKDKKDKMVWTPPEEKIFEPDNPVPETVYFPTRDSNLFPEHVINV